jgi:hypothetical protein
MISAATPDHPAFLPDRNGSDVALCNPDQISGCFHEVLFCPSYFLPEFSFAERTYIDPEGVCFRQRSICDDSTFESCTLESTSGDPQFSKPLWHHTAGLSHNYAVVYFDAAIAAGSVLSKVIGGGQAIDAGYHLVHGREATLDEFHSSEDCRQQVMASMLSEYNAANGTYLRYVDDLPDQDAAKLDLITRMQDEGCSLAFLDGFYEIVAPGDDQHVSIELSVTSGPDLPFPFFAVL